MAPPELTGDPVSRPFVSVRPFTVSVPLDATWKKRKSGVPETVARDRTAPFPFIVMGVVITGRALGPFVVLSTALKRYVHPRARSSLSAAGVELAVLIAAINADTLHGTLMVAADA